MNKPEQRAPHGKPDEIAPSPHELVEQVRTLVLSARRTAVVSINALQVRTNYEIGRLIFEHEQQGRQRADYGSAILSQLADKLSAEFGRGFSRTNLEYMRKFYRIWSSLPAPIPQQPTEDLTSSEIRQKPSGKFAEIPQTPSEESQASSSLIALSWSHYVLLIGIRVDNERRFYEIETASNSWSVAELKRQVASGLYERLALSRDKARVHELAQAQKDALVELTLPKNANIFASAYQLYLPSKEDLRKQLLEWTSRPPGRRWGG